MKETLALTISMQGLRKQKAIETPRRRRNSFLRGVSKDQLGYIWAAYEDSDVHQSLIAVAVGRVAATVDQLFEEAGALGVVLVAATLCKFIQNAFLL